MWQKEQGHWQSSSLCIQLPLQKWIGSPFRIAATSDVCSQPPTDQHAAEAVDLDCEAEQDEPHLASSETYSVPATFGVPFVSQHRVVVLPPFLGVNEVAAQTFIVKPPARSLARPTGTVMLLAPLPARRFGDGVTDSSEAGRRDIVGVLLEVVTHRSGVF